VGFSRFKWGGIKLGGFNFSGTGLVGGQALCHRVCHYYFRAGSADSLYDHPEG
jgi:hypothetical protein